MKYCHFILALIIFSCSSNKKLVTDDYIMVQFKEKFHYGNKTVVQDYTLAVPKGGRLTKGRYDFTGDHHTEYRILYPDSSIIYIGNNNWSGSKLNIINRVESGIRGINKKHVNDSLYFEGTQKSGKYWKENFLGDIVVGYVNVKPEAKENYDVSLRSVRLNNTRMAK